MTSTASPPIPHLVLLAIVALAFLIGGQITFEDWGRLSVRPLAGYLALAVSLHAASRFADRVSTYLRAAAWLVVALMPLHLNVLLRPEVIVPAVAFGVVDVAQHRTGLDTDVEIPAGAGAKGLVGLASLALVALWAVLVPLAQTTLILVRLGLVATAGWAVITGFALRPAIRTPFNLLAGAGAFAVTFALLAGPVLPFGPLLTYWAAILAVAAAVLTATFTRSETALRDEHRVHEQRVRSLPDPVLAPLAERIHDVVAGSEPMGPLSRRIDRARGGEGSGRSIQRRVDELREQGLPGRAARRRALADALDADLDEQGGSST